jgi:hypothetical protein
MLFTSLSIAAVGWAIASGVSGVSGICTVGLPSLELTGCVERKGFTASGRTAPTTLQNAALRLESLFARFGPEGLAAARSPPCSARELSSAYVR